VGADAGVVRSSTAGSRGNSARDARLGASRDEVDVLGGDGGNKGSGGDSVLHLGGLGGGDLVGWLVGWLGVR
jgi:hypothetical protein